MNGRIFDRPSRYRNEPRSAIETSARNNRYLYFLALFSLSLIFSGVSSDRQHGAQDQV